MKLNLNRPAIVDWPVKLGGETFCLSVRPPTKADQMAAMARPWGERLPVWEKNVVGWSGLEDEHGNVLEYNARNYAAAMNIPEFFDAVLATLITAFLRSEPEKNGQAHYGESGANSTTEPQPTTPTE